MLKVQPKQMGHWYQNAKTAILLSSGNNFEETKPENR